MHDTDGDFDLLHEAWIPVTGNTGERLELSLLDCLERANLLREVVDSSPLVTYGMHRFFAAVLQAHLPLEDLDAWSDVWEAAVFPADFIERVQRGCAGRLRLFDAHRPFYQSGDILLAGKPDEELKTVGYLYLEESPGTNGSHFSHRGAASHAYCPVCCARGLLVLPAFAIAGGRGLTTSINGTPPIYVIPRGENLFKTLLLNHVAPTFQPDLRSARDPGPLWEEDGVVLPKDVRSEAGFGESLTWPPRRVRLFPGPAGICSSCGREAATLVRRMVFAQGRSRQKDLPLWDDPWVAFVERPGESQSERLPVRLRGDRALWRDFASLFLLHGEEAVGAKAKGTVVRLRPKVLRQIDQLIAEGMLSRAEAIHFESFALRSDKAKVFEWRQDSFDFPPVLLRGHGTRPIHEALRLAEEVAQCLGDALLRLHPEVERDTKDWKAIRAAMKGQIALWSRNYWLDLEPVFRAYLSDARLLDTQASQRGWLADWADEVRRVARVSFEAALGSVDPNADDLRRQQAARSIFYGGLHRLLSPITTPAAAANNAVGGSSEVEPQPTEEVSTSEASAHT